MERILADAMHEALLTVEHATELIPKFIMNLDTHKY